MNGFEMIALVVFLITTGATICSVTETLNPRPPKPQVPMNKFDAIDKELERLHEEAETYSTHPVWLTVEIGRLNEALVKERKEENV